MTAMASMTGDETATVMTAMASMTGKEAATGMTAMAGKEAATAWVATDMLAKVAWTEISPRGMEDSGVG